MVWTNCMKNKNTFIVFFNFFFISLFFRSFSIINQHNGFCIIFIVPPSKREKERYTVNRKKEKICEMFEKSTNAQWTEPKKKILPKRVLLLSSFFLRKWRVKMSVVSKLWNFFFSFFFIPLPSSTYLILKPHFITERSTWKLSFVNFF